MTDDLEMIVGIVDMRSRRDLWKMVALRRAMESSRIARKAVADLNQDLAAFVAYGMDLHAVLKEIIVDIVQGDPAVASLRRIRRKMQVAKAKAVFEVLKKSQKGG